MRFSYKNIRVLILLSMFFLTICSCTNDNFLSVPPKGKLTNQTVFSSEGNADLFVNDIYDQLPETKNDYGNNSDSFTDNGWNKPSHGAPNSVRTGAISPYNVPTGAGGQWDWERNYRNIRKCNVFLKQVVLHKSNFSASWLKQRTAEVRFLRAYFYTQLFTNYGGVPLITKPLDNLSGDSINYPRASIDQTVSFIEADCDFATANLPATLDRTGRATKGAALTLKGWVELFAASSLCNPNDDLTKWAKAAATNKQVMDMPVYSLFPDYAAQFLAKNNFNNETIFAREYAPPHSGSWLEGVDGPVVVNGVQQGWGNFQPTQSLVDAYSMANGLPITDPASGYDPQHPYVNREPRFYESIIYDGSEWQGDTIYTRVGGNNERGSGTDITNTGYYGRKLLDESITAQVSRALSPSSANWIIFRYAEVLLAYAEAENEAVGPNASVYAAVGQVRKRAGIPNFPLGLSQDEMRINIRRERRVELSYEGSRWFDMRRWKITTGPNGVMTTPWYGMNIVDNGGTLLYTPVKILSPVFYDYQNWMPIPQSDLDKNPKLVQNPGYK